MALGASSLGRLNNRNFRGGLLATPGNGNGNENIANLQSGDLRNMLTTLGVDITKYDPQQMEAMLAQAQAQGMSLQDLLQLFGVGLNGTNAGGKGGDAWNRTDAQKEADKALIKGAIEELGLGTDKADKIKELAESGDARVDYLDVNKNGNHGDIVTFHTSRGDVKVELGGDGEINGGDDRVISETAASATESLPAGLNAVNQGVAAENGEDGALSNDELSSLRAGVLHRSIEGGAGEATPTTNNPGDQDAGAGKPPGDDQRKPPKTENASA